ncbi:hypothetical protein Nepgr_013405 [Nepenthes gracilis]|uniref:Uncharacterized protein n=1 Tax=Nepenthes gracilis TaxID=150966 RepID=A0AAD3XP32_NEPGR|nr:hypothetical protein Nepgr_013405 [Nepenthes gracilis]
MLFLFDDSSQVELVINEQNMLDIFVMIEGYYNLLSERVNLIRQEKCSEFPELQELRAVLMSHFGREFITRAVKLRSNCGVNPNSRALMSQTPLIMILKLSARQPSLESKMKGLKEIASENGINLELKEAAAIAV